MLMLESETLHSFSKSKSRRDRLICRMCLLSALYMPGLYVILTVSR